VEELFPRGHPAAPMPEVRVPRLFTGEEGKGPDLPQHLTQPDFPVCAVQVHRTHGALLLPSAGIHPGRGGPQLLHPREGAYPGGAREDSGGGARAGPGGPRPLCQHPVRRWVEMLQDRFRGITADKETEYERLRQRPGSRP